jgi:hypothetical protein
MPVFRDVDPRELRLPSSRRSGADPFKLQQQIAKYGNSTVGMPPPLVYVGSDGFLMLYDGVTRATRVARMHPGTLLTVEVIGSLPKAFEFEPTIGGTLP